MMGVIGGEVHQSNSGWDPIYVDDNLSVMSIGFLLGDPDDAVIWRGAKKHGFIYWIGLIYSIDSTILK